MLSLLGFLMVLTFMAFIMTNRLSAFVALTTIPLIFGLFAGAGLGVGPMMLEGIKSVAPIAIFLLFAVFYFCIMIDAGLFDPMVVRALKIIRGDPLKLYVVGAVTCTFISLDGDGTTTCLIMVSAFLPIALRLGVNIPKFAICCAAVNSIINLVPWGGPAARITSALGVDMMDLFVPMLPAMGVALLFIWGLAYFFGKKERARLGISAMDDAMLQGLIDSVRNENAEIKQPKLIWVNLALTIIVILSLFTGLLPPPVVFMVGCALALLINFRSIDAQKKRLAANGENLLNVVLMILGAGVFMGIFTGTKMAAEIGNYMANVIPDAWGPHMALLTALLSAPGTFFLSNDAFYFGILPILAEVGALYGVPAVEIGRAGLMGQLFHIMCPYLAAIYLLCVLFKIKISEYQKAMFFPALVVTTIYIVVTTLTGGISL